MIFIVTLIATAVAALLHLFSWGPFSDLVAIPATGLVAMGVMGFIGRLIRTVREHLVGIVPSRLPRPEVFVWITGLLELAGAVGLLIPVTQPWAAAGFALLLICVFPANIKDARDQGAADGSFTRRITVRGAQQVFFLALCVWTLLGGLLPA